VLIVDDSAMMRSVLRIGLGGDPMIEIVGSVSNGEQAWAWLQDNTADVITLDLDMPKGNGMSLLRRMFPMRPVPVVVISGLTQDGAEATLLAMEAGAVDVIAKPVLATERAVAATMTEICERVRAAARARPTPGRAAALGLGARALRTTLATPMLPPSRRVVIALGASTGGVQALSRILPMFPADTPGIVLVQHMPAGFTRAFAERLNTQSAMMVVEARDGDPVQRGVVLVAPGGTQHMRIVRTGAGGYRVALREGPKVCHSCPSVDVLMQSVAAEAGAHGVGAVLTGMGRDGAEGLLQMRRAGAATLAQDEATSVVYGMPQAAVVLGAAMAAAPLDEIPGRILRILAAQRGARATQETADRATTNATAGPPMRPD
jgi:two-component system, chemotaxis family, protein-glutamate methylesterase/glutaminase